MEDSTQKKKQTYNINKIRKIRRHASEDTIFLLRMFARAYSQVSLNGNIN